MPYEDLHMKLFMMSLLEDVRDWFNNLPTFSVNSFQVFQDKFLEQYGNQNAPNAALHELMRIQKNHNDSIYDFN